MNKVLEKDFFHRDCLEVAPQLCGKLIRVRSPDGSEKLLRIAETEAYRGEEDTACHASKGRTARTDILYRESSTLYVYLCYGIHWLLNVVTGEVDQPQAVLIRAGEVPFDGPGKLTRYLGIDKSFNGKSVCGDPLISIEDDGAHFDITALPRVGIDYATEEYRNKLWRFSIFTDNKKRK